MGGQKKTGIEGGNLQHSPLADTSEDKKSFVVLSLADETFAVEIEDVCEIIRVPKITWVPGSPQVVRGVINLRGNIVAVLDLAVMLALPSAIESSQSRIVIVDSRGVKVGMLVDGVSQVKEIDPSKLEPSLPTLDKRQRLFVVAQSNVDDTLIGILDMEKILEQADAASAAEQTI